MYKVLVSFDAEIVCMTISFNFSKGFRWKKIANASAFEIFLLFGCFLTVALKISNES